MIYHNSITTIFKLKSVDNKNPSSCVIPITPITPITRKLLINQINENIQSHRQSTKILDTNANIRCNNLYILIQHFKSQDPQGDFNLLYWLKLLELQLFNESLELQYSNIPADIISQYLEELSSVPYCSICNIPNYLPEDVKDQNERKNNIVQLLPKPFCNCINCMKSYRWYLILFIIVSLYHLCHFIEIHTVNNVTDLTQNTISNIFLDMMLLKRSLQDKCVKNKSQHDKILQNITSYDDCLKKMAIGQLLFLCRYIKSIKALNSHTITQYILYIDLSIAEKLRLYFRKQQDLFIEFQNTQLVSNKQINEIKKLIDQLNQQKDNQTTLNTKDITKLLSKINQC